MQCWKLAGIGLCMLTLGLAGAASGQNQEAPWVGKIVSIQGQVLAKRQGQTQWQPARLNDTFNADDSLRVGPDSRAAIVLRNEALLRLDQNTTILFKGIEEEKTSLLELLKGAGFFFSREPRSLKVITPFVNGVVRGTEFLVRVDSDRTFISLFDGRVLADNAKGSLLLAKGQSAVALADQPPRLEVVVRPRDAVQWTLYYPPILAFSADDFKGVRADDWQARVRQSILALGQGDLNQAFVAMEGLGPGIVDPRYFAYRAAVRLTVGRASEAQADIAQALSLDRENSQALALRAILAVVQNRKDNAYADAKKAVDLDPDSAAARIALSYAEQSRFNLHAARDQALAATQKSPANALAWARLAELHLSTGELDQALAAARQAAQLNPRLGHIQTILGYAYLTQIKIDDARQAFQDAIQLDTAAPLPRLGLGLAKIRRGDLKEGRAEIEVAAGLDPDNSLIRSYLGKAYFDEKRRPLDEHQFEMAKALDPQDPTPWFYDAIRKQTENRPVEALQDLQKSIELNDNRAVYRSRLLLDEDLAARSASLGMIYNDLNFQQLALIEGYKSLNSDSTNYSAHRLLADNYAAKPRHEIARVSELLQSQLLQPLNLTPLQPHLAESDTNVITGAGPSGLSFNEYNPLFTRNRLAIQGSGIFASNRTWGDEITGSALYDRISGSIGSFHYDTNGIRENNDYNSSLYNVFLQGSLTSNANLQAEYRYSENESGDLSRNFDGSFSNELRDETSMTLGRIGGHYCLSPQFKLIASYIHSEVAYENEETIFGSPSVLKEDTDGDLFELRSDFSSNFIGLVAGFTYMNGDMHDEWRVEGSADPLMDVSDLFIKTNAFAYSNFNIRNRAVLTVGLSDASMEKGSQIEKQQLNHKLGLTLQPFAQTTLRLAAFRVLSSTFVSSQTVEPTHVAGFSQFFDDLDGSDVESYGIAVDQKISKRLFAGIEYLQRNLKVPLFTIGKTAFFQWKEFNGLAYIYWVPSDSVALRAEYQYEQFDRSQESAIDSGIVDLETHRVPLSVGYFHLSGFAFRTIATYFSQEGEFLGTEDTENVVSGSDRFWILDAEVAYRLPKRWGMISVGVKNMLDEEFNYQDTDPANPTVIPGVFAFSKITLSF